MKTSCAAPPTLRQLQQWMAARILPQPAAAPAPCAAALDAWLCVPAAARIDDRLAVYREGYPARVGEALGETYPAVARALGARGFAALVERYAAAIPLSSYNLNDAGAQLAAFLSDDPATADLVFLADLAALEWQVAAAFHAFDGDPLDPRTLPWSLDDWTAAVLAFQPSVSVLTSRWPLLELWAARDTVAVGDVRQADAQGFVVRRHGETVRCELVSTEEVGALRLLLAGHRLVDAVEALAAAGTDASQVGAWFGHWTASGMLASARRGERSSARAGAAETAAARRASERHIQRRRREPATQQRRSV